MKIKYCKLCRPSKRYTIFAHKGIVYYSDCARGDETVWYAAQLLYPDRINDEIDGQEYVYPLGKMRLSWLLRDNIKRACK